MDSDPQPAFTFIAEIEKGADFAVFQSGTIIVAPPNMPPYMLIRNASGEYQRQEIKP